MSALKPPAPAILPPQPDPQRLRVKKRDDRTPPLNIVENYYDPYYQGPPPGYQPNLEVYHAETPIINVSVEQDLPQAKESKAARKTRSSAPKTDKQRKMVKEAQREVRAAIQKVNESIALSQGRKSSKLK
mmetsp:Transcript_21664/g.33344  ORF Transcript_21664/g.33344 Transcript_21664/m.33344 type:complete len:130 (-) Transcript_21664:3136-3525(-)